jgi:HK97 family phage portal protein
MGIISSIKENRSTLKNPRKWLVDFFRGGTETYAGKRVDEEKAMEVSAVFACVDRLSSAMAALPLQVYKDTEKGREKARNHFAYSLLHEQPNDELTSFTFRQLQMAHLLLWGNSYAEIERDNANRAKKLHPLPPWKVEPKKDDSRGLYYELMVDGKKRTLYQDQVLHIRSLGLDGLKGLSRIAMARQAVGLSMATEEYGARFFGNGAHPGGIVEYPETLSDEAYDRYKKDMRQKYEGLSKAHRLMLLEEGMKYHQTGIPPEDSQFLETRKFQLTEIARIYNVPLHLLQQHEKSTSWGTGIEEMNIGFVVFSLTPYLVNWEQELDKKVVTTKGHYAEHNVEGLLRGDSESRAEFYNTMFNIGAYSINDIREKENENEIGPAGNVHYVPLNMIPAEEATNIEAGDDENNNRYKKALKEFRARRSATKRRNIRDRYKSKVRNAAEKVVGKEIKAIRKILEQELRNEQNFRDKIVSFYDEFPDEIQNEMRPVLKNMADDIAAEAASEINLEDYSINDFFEDYMTAMAGGYTGYSRGQLLALMDEAVEKNKNAADLIEERLENWEEKRVEKVTTQQTVKVEGAISRTVFAAGGITKLVWIANPGACEICQEMDGAVVGIEQNFLGTDETIQKKGGYSASGPKSHPPLHESCLCSISPQ